jgi:hypothetical protein
MLHYFTIIHGPSGYGLFDHGTVYFDTVPILTLKLEAVYFSETLVYTYNPIRYLKPEAHRLNSYLPDCLKPGISAFTSASSP